MARSPEVAVALQDTVVQELKRAVRGAVIRRGEANYDGARRLYNGLVKKRPELVIRCAGASDVVHAVQFARAHGLPVAIRSGGHHIAGLALCDGGLVIDLSRLRGLRVDPTRRTALAQPGVTWGEYQQEAQAFGLVTPAGVISSTGIAGLTLGGGIGWLQRRYGLTIDHLLAVDIVTADGTLRRASADENPDLFWAVRGAGANFGVVTALEFQLQPVSTVQAGNLVYPMPRAKEILRAYREFTASCPDDLSVLVFLANSPEGMPVVIASVCHVGTPEAAESDLRPLRELGPVADQMATMPFAAWQTAFDPLAPYGQYACYRTGYLDGLPDDAIEALVERAAAGIPGPFSLVLINHLRGAIAQVRPDETAYSHRDAEFYVWIVAAWPEAADTERMLAWANGYWRAVRPFTNGVYVNALDDEGQDRVRSAYGA
ncbi:MAG: FAD-binding oxidoreductase, partial [Chloroflexi bacterium]|nr:FAD-binding oxidoreductase [Chloroflexota bacterium]